MTPAELARVSEVLRKQQGLEKTAGVLGKARDLAKAVQRRADVAGNALIEGGMPLAGTAAKLLPVAGAAYGAKKVYESDPVQRMRYKYSLWQAQRAAKQAQRGYY